jgi:predicted DNA-binding transcriptional regulator AlpA
MGELKNLPDWPARLSEERAAEYLSTSRSTFRFRVATGEYPSPVREGVRKYWSRRQLDGYIEKQFGHYYSNFDEDETWADLR